MMRLATIMLLMSPLAVMAEDFPARYAVSGVSSDNVLNIRAAPGAGSARIGELGPDTTDIEVLGLSENGRWGRIGMPEGNGWVAMRYLARQDQPEGTVIPRPLSCRGTEPFWRIGLLSRGDIYERLGENPVDLDLVAERPGDNGYEADLSAPDGTGFSLVVARGTCLDGMSDREFGWTGTLRIGGQGQDETLQGCCTLDHRQGE
ncbi:MULTISPECIES: COG3650 family protein [Tabrizicola]|uniref:COG3650 family protein n=1 Tax=Tabrizicola TaxID=1443919 RepID=UPI0014366CF1|nr:MULTISPECIES: SH3 domain-containing protein [Paracoccaceae]